MGRKNIRMKIRRRKVANLAAYSRQHTVKNCTIPKVNNPGTGEWDIPKEGFPQPKNLTKKESKKLDYTFRPKGRAWYMEQVVQHKLAKWERKNPCPVKQDQNPPDIFEQEYVVPWKALREQALERIRDFVVSMYDKLPLTGRFQKSDNEFVEEKIADLKDYNGDGHKINQVQPEKSKVIKNAQKITNHVHAKKKNLVCTNLKDHKRQKGRIILPKAA